MPQSGEQPKPKKAEVTGARAKWPDFGQVGRNDLNDVTGIHTFDLETETAQTLQQVPPKKTHWWQRKGSAEKPVEPDPNVDDYRTIAPEAVHLSVSGVRSETDQQVEADKKLGKWAKKLEEKRKKEEAKKEKAAKRKMRITGVDPSKQDPLF